MLEKIKTNQIQFYQQAIEPLLNKRYHHAYLVETNGNEPKVVYEYVRQFVKFLFLAGKNENSYLSDEKINYLIDLDNFPDLLMIKPENNIIKKEQLLRVKEQFKEKSIYGTVQIYIIDQADKLNVSAANTLLKFLEEPEEGIIAIFLTDNRYRILDTIRSRCFITSFVKERDLSVSIDYNSPITEFAKNILTVNN